MRRTRYRTKRQKWVWTELHLNRLGRVLDVLNELEEYKPLTVRQIFYQLVGKGSIPNNSGEVGKVEEICKWGRIDGYISPWDIKDETRREYDLTGWQDSETFISEETERYLTGYRRDLLQTQPVRPEIWVEKNALSTICTKVASQYTMRVQVMQNPSTTRLFEFVRRVEQNAPQQTMVLFFSDFDPQGDNMMNAAQQTLEENMGLTTGVKWKQVALCFGDGERYGLYQSPNAIKSGDTSAKRFRKKYGDDVIPYELDALPYTTLEVIIKDAIETELDMELFEHEKEIEVEEISILKHTKDKVKGIIDYD